MMDIRVDGNGRVYKLVAVGKSDAPYLTLLGVLEMDADGAVRVRPFERGDKEFGDGTYVGKLEEQQ